MAKQTVATQEGYFVGRVVSGSIEEKVFKEGTPDESKATIYKLNILTADGVFANIERRQFGNPDNLPDFVKEDIEDLTKIIEATTEATYKDSKEDHIYVGKYLKPGKEGDMKYEKFRTWTDKKGMLKFSIEGSVKRIKTSTNEEGDVLLHFTNRTTGAERTELFKDKKTILTLKMVVAETIQKGTNAEDWQVVLTDGKEKFPLQVTACLGDLAEHGFPPVGVGVEAHVELRRGERGQVERGTAAYGNSEKKVSLGTSDKVWIKSIPAMINDLTLEGGTPESATSMGGTDGKSLF